MMDVSELVNDPDLGAVSFTVNRTTYRRSRGQLIPSNETTTATGCIHPGTPEMLNLLPTEERAEHLIQIYTSFPLSDGENTAAASFTAPDRITYAGHTWRIVKVRDWPAFHYYQALAVLVKEEEEV